MAWTLPQGLPLCPACSAGARSPGGLEREQLVTVGDFGSEAPCTTVEKDHRYIFFMDPTAEPLVFKASYAPVDASEPELKKEVERVLCEDCASAPKLRLMRGQSLLEGDKLYLKCEASGNPSPSFRWYKDGHELQKGRDLKIKTNKKNSKVQISRVRVEDSGNYTCVAENSLGQENVTSIISVQICEQLSISVSHARPCLESDKAYCVNGGDCYIIHGINQLSCKHHCVVAPTVSPPSLSLIWDPGGVDVSASLLEDSLSPSLNAVYAFFSSTQQQLLLAAKLATKYL
uniref:Neuregulin 2b n=1 Tax=Sphaeramia orbicularis TaxID=375764 RepID=A0A673C0N5_9TELE